MTEHLTRAIADKLYFAFGRLHCFEDSLSNLKHTAVVLGAYVDYLSPDLVDIRVQQLVQRLAMFLNEDPVARCATIAVDSDRFIEQTTRDEPWYSFFQVLKWSVVIERSHNDCRNIVGSPI